MIQRRDRLQFLTILVLVLAIGTQYQTRKLSENGRKAIAEILERQLRGEDLIGRMVPVEVEPSSNAKPGLKAYWIVDLDSCIGCTEDLENWNSLGVCPSNA
jgi:hypothetical protein